MGESANRAVKVSVLMPTYNHAGTIARAIESYLMQDCAFDTELLISDDASTDGTLAIAERYAAENPDIRVIHKSSNEGLIRNYKTLVEAAKGEYFAILESDDYWIDPQKLTLQVNFLDSHPDYVLSFSRVQLLFSKYKGQSHNCANLVEKLDGNLYDHMLLRSIIYSPSVVFRRESFEKYCNIDDYVKENFITFDYPVWLSLAAHGKIHYISHNTASYYVSTASISNNGSLKKRLAFEKGVNRIRSYVVSLYGAGSVGKVRIKLREALIYSRIVWRYIF